ncbi:MAG: hypothetical protein AAGI91_17500 [Bacteroidota bacterium]
MPDDPLRRALLDHAAACDAAGMPRCARIAARLASGRPHPAIGDAAGRDPVAEALAVLVEISGDSGGADDRET